MDAMGTRDDETGEMTEKAHQSTSRLRPAQVLATALAALTGAFLASKLGVYGTVAGAGVFSFMTTVGSELYLRSLDRTRQAALRTKEAALARTARMPAAKQAAEPVEQAPDLPAPATPDTPNGQDQPPAPSRRLQWSLVVTLTVAAFALGMLAVTGIEAVTGKTLSGDDGKTVGKVLTGKQNGGQTAPKPGPVVQPSEAPSTPPSVTATSEPVTDTSTQAEPSPAGTEQADPPPTDEPDDEQESEEPSPTQPITPPIVDR